MYICVECLEDEYPTAANSSLLFPKSFGPCEFCGHFDGYKVCYEIPGRYLNYGFKEEKVQEP